MPQVSLLLQCSVNPNDQLISYVTDQERKDLCFAMVMTNDQEQKISVVLNKADAALLRDQLDRFLKE